MTQAATQGAFLVGLTGGIASGKTTVCKGFEHHGIDVIDADVIAREVVALGTEGLDEIVSQFGDGVLDQNGTLNRRKLRNLVFAQPDLRVALERIVHPRVRREMWRQAAKATSAYVILAVPLLIEGGLQHAMHRTAVVDVSESTQRRRLSQRDGSSPEQIDGLLAAQTSRKQRLAAADDTIDNNGDRDALAPQIAALHRRYLRLATRRLSPVQVRDDQ